MRNVLEAAIGIGIVNVPLARLVLTAALSALSVCAVVAASAGQKANRLQDIRIGEQERYTRIVLMCRSGCNVRRERHGFLLPTVSAEFSIDLENRSQNADAIRLTRQGNGSLLSLKSQKALLRSAVTECVIKNAPATCIDLEFSRLPYPTASLTSAGGMSRGVAKPPTSPGFRDGNRRVVNADDTSRRVPETPGNNPAVSLSAPASALASPPAIALQARPSDIASLRDLPRVSVAVIHEDDQDAGNMLSWDARPAATEQGRFDATPLREASFVGGAGGNAIAAPGNGNCAAPRRFP